MMPMHLTGAAKMEVRVGDIAGSMIPYTVRQVEHRPGVRHAGNQSSAGETMRIICGKDAKSRVYFLVRTICLLASGAGGSGWGVDDPDLLRTPPPLYIQQVAARDHISRGEQLPS